MTKTITINFSDEVSDFVIQEIKDTTNFMIEETFDSEVIYNSTTKEYDKNNLCDYCGERKGTFRNEFNTDLCDKCYREELEYLEEV